MGQSLPVPSVSLIVCYRNCLALSASSSAQLASSLWTTFAKNVSLHALHAVVDLIVAIRVMGRVKLNLHTKSSALKIAQLDQRLTLNR
jgi:hypothetical protein